MNRSKDLRALFRQSLINERTRHKPTSTYGVYSGGNPMYGGIHGVPSSIMFNKDVKIYFYEWSDITKAPRCFNQVDSFDNFLKNCGIYMELYQREIIKSLNCVYVTCYTGTKRLNIRATYKDLLESMNEFDNKKLLSNINGQQKISFEVGGSGIESNGTFFG